MNTTIIIGIAVLVFSIWRIAYCPWPQARFSCLRGMKGVSLF
jgi:hypothetical protein